MAFQLVAMVSHMAATWLLVVVVISYMLNRSVANGLALSRYKLSAQTGVYKHNIPDLT